MIKTTENFLIKYDIKDKNVILGFSCGPDSCALALILKELSKKYRLNIILAYFNHMWRNEAYQEEKFAQEFAIKNGFEFYFERAPENTKPTEENARKLRYDFFEKTASKFSTDVVFLGHNKNDNVETLIYRIVKGTSIKGLSSIPEKRDIFYRPILSIEKKEILNFLKKNKQEYLIDSSNDNVKYKRNLIRKEILPLFEKINPNYLNNIEILINNSIFSSEIILNKLNEIKKEILVTNEVDFKKYSVLGIELRYEFLNDYLRNELKYRDFKTIKKIDDFILSNKNSKISLSANSFLKINDSKFYICKNKIKNDNEISITSCGEFEFENIILNIEKNTEKIKVFPKPDDNYCFLNLDDDFHLTLRHRKNGDRFSPCGILSDKMKLKDYLINQKISQEKKDELIVLANNNEICWILGLQISEKYKVKQQKSYKLEWKINEKY